MTHTLAQTGARCMLPLLLLPVAALAQDVTTTTMRLASGERVVRVETTLTQSPQAVWKLFATEAGLKCWAAPVVRLDLRTGGRMETNYDVKVPLGGPGTITLPILNVVDGEFLTYKVNLNDAFSAKLRSEDGTLQQVVRLQPLPDGGTRIISTMLGWGTGPDWDKTLEFFVKGNDWSFRELAKCAAKVPS